MIKSMLAPVMLTLALTATAQAKTPEAPRAPVEVAKAFEQRFNAGDLESLSQLYSQDSVFVPAPGVALNDTAQVRGALTQFMASKVPIHVTVREIYQAGDTALIVSDWVMKGAGADGKPVDLAGTGADVVRRRADGTWIYAIDNPFGVARPTR